MTPMSVLKLALVLMGLLANSSSMGPQEFIKMLPVQEDADSAIANEFFLR